MKNNIQKLKEAYKQGYGDGTDWAYEESTLTEDLKAYLAQLTEKESNDSNKQTKTQDWEEEFKNTKLVRMGGSCFECCDYEDMVEDMQQFIREQIEKARRETVEGFVDWLDSNSMEIEFEYYHAFKNIIADYKKEIKE